MEKIFENILNVVSEYTGLSKEQVLTGKTEECVNYRAMLLCVLHDLGFSDALLSRYTKLTRQGVNKLRNSLPYRKKHNLILSTTCQRISNHLATENLLSN